MSSLLNSREFASLIWLTLLGVFFLFKPSVRKAVFGLVRAALQPMLVRFFLISASYVACLAIGLHLLEFWSLKDLKPTIIWFLLVAIPAMSVAISHEHTSFGNSLLSWVKSNLRFLVILEFLVGLNTFPLWGELLFIPLVTILAMTSVVAGMSEETKKAKVFLDWCLTLIGVFLIIGAMSYVGNNFEKVSTQRTLQDFLLGPTLSLLLLPFSYLIHVTVKYSNIFGRLERFCPKPLLARAKALAAYKFRGNTKLASEWANCFHKSTIDTNEKLHSSLNLYKGLPKRFNDPASVSREVGWSPYLALCYLENYGLAPFIYQPILENNWGGATNKLTFGDRSFANSIDYRVDGNETVASYLKLALDVSYQQDNVEELLELYRELANILAQKAMGIELPTVIGQAIAKIEEAEYEDELYRVEISLTDYREKSAGYSLRLKFYHRSAYQAYLEREAIY